MIEVEKTLKLLGLRATDKVTGYTGVITSVSFDLYGCVQVIINPGVGQDGKLKDCLWFDVSRLTIGSTKPVMPLPDFDVVSVGPESKPIP